MLFLRALNDEEETKLVKRVISFHDIKVSHIIDLIIDVFNIEL